MRGPVVVLCLLAALAAAGCGASAPGSNGGDDGYLPVPDVKGLDVDQATTSIRDGFLMPVVSGDAARGAGCVVASQTPRADEWAVTDEKVTLVVDCSGGGGDAFDAAYREGFDAGCDQLFAEAPDGTLYAKNVGYGVDDCRRLRADPARRPADDAAAADPRKLGRRDGCRALFDKANVRGFGARAVTVTIDRCNQA